MNYLNSSLVESRAEPSAKVRACNIANIELWMLLSLVGALSANLSLPLGEKLQ